MESAVRLILSLFALALAGPVLAQGAEQVVQALYKAKKWSEALARADAGPATGETEFWAARCLRNPHNTAGPRPAYHTTPPDPSPLR